MLMPKCSQPLVAYSEPRPTLQHMSPVTKLGCVALGFGVPVPFPGAVGSVKKRCVAGS